MRILMLNNEFPPLGGGTGTVNHALLRYLTLIQGLEIDLVTSALGKRAEEEVFAQRITIYKVPVVNKNIHHSSNRELTTYAIRGLFRALRLHRKRNYDLCLAWSAVPAGAIALLLKRWTGLRYLVRVCGPDIPDFELRYKLIYRFVSPLIHAVWHGAEVVVAKSDTELRMIRKLEEKVNVSLVPNGVDLSAFKPSGSLANSGPLRLLCVGRLIERKGQHHLIHAVKQLTDDGIDVTLDLVGLGDARSANETQVERLRLKDRVHFHGYVPREEIAKYYAAADVFVLPSYNEGMSIALLEAMGAGLPTIVTRTGGTAELVEPGINGYIFEWGEIETLTNHLRRLAKHRGLTRQMGAASRARAEKFSCDLSAQRLWNIMEQLLIDGPGNRSSNLNYAISSFEKSRNI